MSATKLLQLENFKFKEQVNSRTVLFEQIAQDEPQKLSTSAPCAAADDDQNQMPSKRRSRPTELMVSMELLAPPFDEQSARDVMAKILHNGTAGGEHAESDPQTSAARGREGKPSDVPTKTFENDRYSKYTMPNCVDACFELVYPAVGKDIVKKRAIPLFRVVETRQLYDTVTVPKLVVPSETRDNWVVEILEGRKEAEHVLYADEKVVLVKDYKWADECNLDECQYLAIFKDTTVRSLRDLDGLAHLDTLKFVLEQCGKKIADKHFTPEALAVNDESSEKNADHGIMVADGQPDAASGFAAAAADGGEKNSAAVQGTQGPGGQRSTPPQMIFFLHYHPTFWYFHVHICSTRCAMFENDKGGEGLLLTSMDRFHKLENVIQLLKLDPSLYQKADLTTVVRGEAMATMYGVEM